METIRFGIIGCGLMGREFASAAARWAHLTGMQVRPEIVAVCNTSPARMDWFKDNFSSVRQSTADYRELLANPDVTAVYCAVPHHLHREIYCAAIAAGKHLMAEKPFGIDLPASRAILDCIRQHPDVFVRCSSEFPFYPAVQQICGMIETGAFGRVIEVQAAFLHSSDLDRNKPINWKRMTEFNGEYGCLGDLGMHVCHVPFRAGWYPLNVRAIFSKIVDERPDGKGGMAPCRTWDNATLLCETGDNGGHRFPMTLRTFRIAPGEKNSWSLQITGEKACARFSTRNPKLLELLEYTGSRQAWAQMDVGYEPTYKCITGGIFEFGFTDAILQMWAAFLTEMTTHETPSRFAACVTPDEAALSHRLFTAALESQKKGITVMV